MVYNNADNWFRRIDRKIGPKGARTFMLAAFTLVLASTPARGWQTNLVDYPGGSGGLIELDTFGKRWSSDADEAPGVQLGDWPMDLDD